MGAVDRNAVHSAGGRLAYGVTDFTANSGAFPYDGTELGLVSTTYVIPPRGVYALPMEEDQSTARYIYTGGDAIAGAMMAGVTDTDLWTALFPGAAVGGGFGGGDSLVFPASVGQTATTLSNLYFESDSSEHLNWLMPLAVPMWEESERLYFSHYRRQYYPIIFRSQSDDNGRAIVFSTLQADLVPPTPSGVFGNNLLGHWVADQGVTKDGSDRVSAWASQATGGETVAQSTDDNKPVWTSAAVGGNDALLFDGTDDWLELLSGVGAAFDTDPLAIYVVGTLDVGNTQDAVAFQIGATTQLAQYLRLGVSYSGGVYTNGEITVVGSGGTGYAGTANTITDDAILLLSGHTNSAETLARLDGGTAATGSAATHAPTSEGLIVGARRFTAIPTIVNHWKGYIAEIIVASVDPTTAQETAIESYINDRYGTSF